MFKKYSVNDISKYFSIPKQTIRFYEDKGLIHSHRDSQNGYRYYTYEDINQIFDLAIFHPLGSNLQELNTLLNKGDPDDYQSMLLQKKHELQEKINHLQSLNMQIDSIVGKIQQAQKGINKTFKIETCPRLIINNLTDYSPHGVCSTPHTKRIRKTASAVVYLRQRKLFLTGGGSSPIFLDKIAL